MRTSTRVLTRGGAALVAVLTLSLGPVASASAEQPAGKGPAQDQPQPGAGKERQDGTQRERKQNQGSTQPGCDGSHHSDTGHGANTRGPYDETCDGSPSRNGNGGGVAKGRPCAGCVGNADAKNPPGQLPGPSDRNKGYECDGNSGIARTNPAHTGCQAPPAVVPAVVPTCPAGTTMTKDVNGDGKVDTADCVRPPKVEVDRTEVVEVVRTEVKDTTLTRPLTPASVRSARLGPDRPEVLGGTLPVTGSGSATLAGLALVLLAAGAVLVVCSPSRQ